MIVCKPHHEAALLHGKLDLASEEMIRAEDHHGSGEARVPQMVNDSVLANVGFLEFPLAISVAEIGCWFSC